MVDSVFALNRTLQGRLSSVLEGHAPAPPARTPRPAPVEVIASPRANPDPTAPLRVVVTAYEVNNLHGTGPLVKRICSGWPNVFSIRARNDWGGVHEFGDWQACLAQRAETRAEFFHTVLSVLRGRQVETVVCVPFLRDDFLTAIAIQECFGARLCGYVMDDQNVATRNISDSLMREFLERCSLRLITHPELRFAYEAKYQLPFSILPAIVPAALIATQPTAMPVAHSRGRRGALIGSFWDQRWFDRLCAALEDCGCEIDWFGNNTSPWFNFVPRSLARARIAAHGVIPEEQLARELKKYPFVIVPVGELNGSESNQGVARLSLPGRILFALATSHTPILIVGSARTCAARFVTHFGVGEVVPYHSGEIADAMERLSRPENQRRMRARAAHIAPAFSDHHVADWLARSIELGAPADARFEDVFADYDSAIELHD